MVPSLIGVSRMRSTPWAMKSWMFGDLGRGVALAVAQVVLEAELAGPVLEPAS